MFRFALCAAFFSLSIFAQDVSLQLSFDRSLGPMDIDRVSLGQGGLSPDPMWQDRVAEVRALHPRLIRLFVQEYFDLLPAAGQYDFKKLDRSVDLIVAAGATPLMSLTFKPRVLYPVVDQQVVEPGDYGAWEELVYRMVRHYQTRSSGITYWEVGNEPDIGEDGGCPYLFKPDSYRRYYEHTTAAILRADPHAKVGGPALASCKSPILPALLDLCSGGKVPLHFVSWHIYNSDPAAIRGTVEDVKGLLKKYPSLQPETVLDEWNMALTTPPKDPRVQPCFVAEVAWQMRDAGLDLSCYYHIRDYHVDRDLFARFFSAKGASFMADWWNRMPQYDGLFDYQNTVRPTYFTFKLLSRLTGNRLAAESNDSRVHAFFTHDPVYDLHSLLVWNFSPERRRVVIRADGLTHPLVAHRRGLDASAASSDENVRLRPLEDIRVAPTVEVELEPYAVEFWSIEKTR